MSWAKQHENTGGELIIDWESLHARFRAGTNRRRAPQDAPSETIT